MRESARLARELGILADREVSPSAQFEGEIDATLGKTLYLPIALSSDVIPRVGVFIPRGYQKSRADVDIIVYLHGNIISACKTDPGAFTKTGIEYYWNTPLFLCLRQELAHSGSAALLVAPTLSTSFGSKDHPPSRFGNLHQDGRLDFLISETLGALKQAGELSSDARPRELVLAAHSAGGRPMQNIVAAGNKLQPNITQCWGFECLYFGTSTWVKWLSANPGKRFIHYRRPSKFVARTKDLEGYRNFTDVKDGTGHCVLLKQKWRSAINQWQFGALAPVIKGVANVLAGRWPGAAAPKSTTPQAQAAAQPISVRAGGFAEEDLLKVKPLSSGRKALLSLKDGKKRVGIVEAPAVYVPEIVRLGGEAARRENKATLAALLNPDTWFKQMTRKVLLANGATAPFSFLGRELPEGQYLHVEMAKLLQEIESRFVRDLNTSSQAAGNVLLNNSQERISGTRAQSSTAKYSFHMFGLAVDCNYLGNPFIEKGDIETLDDVLKNAAGLTNSAVMTFTKDASGDIGARYDYIQKLDELLERYLGLVDSPGDLERHRAAAPAWRQLSQADATAKIQKDLDRLSVRLVRGGKRQPYFKKNAILNLDRRFVVGMERGGLYWGGRYGDMMHFDMRGSGVGAYIQEGRKQFEANLKALAKRLLASKQYGTYLSDGRPVT